MTDTQTFEPEGRAIPFAVEGAGPGVVLIAGAGLNISYLNALAHSVAMEDFRVVRIGSRRPSKDEDAADRVPVTIEDLARDVVDVLDHLGMDHAWVGGHGFGGSVARVVALGHHDRVNGVLLLGVESDGTVDAPDLAEVPERFRDSEVEALQRAARGTGGSSALAADVPVLIIQGAEDPITPPANGDALKQSAPDRVSVVRVEGAGHMFPATHVGATSWAIEDYLDWD
ncbi:alpha/beta fold hydrolase [Microbacterium sp. P01]|uniref:alpha/beta fold hydrolase n=1 Tax=Microbacterium sp. P01 TaxID=3366261 RepID=UPI00366DD674